MNKTGFISPDGIFIEIPYYEVNSFAQKRCYEYIEKSIQNKNTFNAFSKEYKTFNPYFDFLVCVLGYVFVNPLNYQNTIMYFDRYIKKMKAVTDLNRPVNNLIEEDGRFTYLMPSSDVSLEIQPFKNNIMLDGIIMPNGNFLVLDRTILGVHEVLAEQILNELLIKNKELYEDYTKYIEDKCCGKVLFPMPHERNTIDYLGVKLGYIRYAMTGNSSLYIYNSLLLTDDTSKIVKYLEKNIENNGNDILDLYSFNEEEIDKSKRLIMQM